MYCTFIKIHWIYKYYLYGYSWFRFITRLLFYEYIYIYRVYAQFVILLLPNLFRIGNWKASRVYEECFDVNQWEFDSCKKIPERLFTCPFLSEIFNYAICVKYLLEIYRDVQDQVQDLRKVVIFVLDVDVNATKFACA